jgi:hypothetical protein
MMALMENARNCPPTIMSSLMVTMRPRRCTGAISARNIGTIADAAPTASPRMMRAPTMISNVGAAAAPTPPKKNSREHTMSAFLRPRLSAIFPPRSAPKIAPNSNELTTVASWTVLSCRSSTRNGSAPEITPVS